MSRPLMLYQAYNHSYQAYNHLALEPAALGLSDYKSDIALVA